MKKQTAVYSALAALGVLIPLTVNAQKPPAKARVGKICGNPQIECRSGEVEFKPYEIGFEIPSNNIVIYESEPFYAVILKTVKLKSDAACETAISEDERLEIQELFPSNKVFALKCLEAGDIYYTNVAYDLNFIAVYAGKTLAAANDFLKTVKATGRFQGANVRKMQAGINGT